MIYKLSRKKKIVVLTLTAIFFALGYYLVDTVKAINNAVHVKVIGCQYLSHDELTLIHFLSDKLLLKKTEFSQYILEYTFDEGVYYINDNEITVRALALNKGQEFYLVETNTYMFKVKG